MVILSRIVSTMKLNIVSTHTQGEDTMTLSCYLKDVLSHFKDTRIVHNVTSFIQNMIEHTSTRLWSISKDKAEFDRSKRLLNGSLQSVLDEQTVSGALRVVGSQQMQAKLGDTRSELLVLLHDPV